MFDQVYLTGFKIFGGHQVNPTQLLAEHFSEHKVEGVETAVIEVAAKEADAYIEKIRTAIGESKDKKVLNLHFGVGPNKVYHLEQCSYNNKDFGIPDNHGYKPLNEKICPNEALDHPIYSKLDLKALEQQLSADFKVALSLDPGRYLCNYIYFKSSHDLSTPNENVYSLFVHFPDLSISPHETNVKFVQKLLHLLLKSQSKE
jgi:pyroglutamyl-peptidase